MEENEYFLSSSNNSQNNNFIMNHLNKQNPLVQTMTSIILHDFEAIITFTIPRKMEKMYNTCSGE